MTWLFDPKMSPDAFNDGSVSLFHALGESNEVREVFRRILEEKIPFDEVELLVTTVDPYVPLIYEIASSLISLSHFPPASPWASHDRGGRCLTTSTGRPRNLRQAFSTVSSQETT